MVYEKDKIDFRILDDSNYKLIKDLQQDIYTRNWNEGEIEHLLEKGGGKGLILGLCVAFIGLAVDNLIRTWAERRKQLLGLS